MLSPQTGALLVALLAEAAAAAAMTDSVDLLENGRLLAWCIIGCCSGAFVKVGILPPRRKTNERNLRQLALEFAVAMISGFCLTPMVLFYFSLPTRPMFALGVSFVVSLIATGVIHAVAPLIERMAIKRFEDAAKGRVLQK